MASMKDATHGQRPADYAGSETSKMALSDRLKKIRLSLDKAQIEMNALLDLGKRSWQRYEKGDNIPGSQVIAALAGQGFNAHWILTGEGEMRIEGGAENEEIKRLTSENEALKEALVDLQWKTSVPVVGLAECGITGWQVKRPSSLKTQPPPDMAEPNGTFAVIALGDSMVPLGINDGFLLYCEDIAEPEQFDIVYVEAKDNRATVKLFVGYSKKGKDDYLTLEGYLPSEDGLPQEPFTLEIAKSQVARIAVVRYIKRGL